MRVLVVESDRRAADKAITDLQAAGHHVMRCHETDLPAFPCNALCDKGTCPIDTQQGSTWCSTTAPGRIQSRQCSRTA